VDGEHQSARAVRARHARDDVLDATRGRRPARGSLRRDGLGRLRLGPDADGGQLLDDVLSDARVLRGAGRVRPARQLAEVSEGARGGEGVGRGRVGDGRRRADEVDGRGGDG
jgi:hypothetical protein